MAARVKESGRRPSMQAGFLSTARRLPDNKQPALMFVQKRKAMMPQNGYPGYST
jgi:hypothetical protein